MSFLVFVTNPSTLYPILSLFTNYTNSFDKLIFSPGDLGIRVWNTFKERTAELKLDIDDIEEDSKSGKYFTNPY